ncbi:MAG: restriction endonuclease subunit S, partial [Candidatus Electrothrix sp. AR1]|nr:restriction endonuclease subunit S [Candidatus Electrothrix sp. AR1]
MQSSIVSYLKLQEHPEFRIDAECYKPYHLKIEQSIKEKGFRLIEDCSISVINFGAYSLCNHIEFLDYGKPFLVTEDIKNNVIETGKLHYIAEEVHLLLHKSHCVKGQVLLTMAGAYLGQAAVFNEDFECSSNQAIAKITLKPNSISPYWLSTFLNCKHGQSQIERFKTGTGQPNLNLGLIKLIKVVEASAHFQAKIEQLVKNALVSRQKSLNIYEETEILLFSELGLTDWHPKHCLSFVRNYSETEQAGRLDAEYFQPKYEKVLSALWKNNGVPLHEIASVRKGRQARSTTGTIPYASIKDINNNLIETSEFAHYDKRLVTVRKNDLALAITGATIGKVGINIKDEKIAICGDLLKIRTKNVSPYYFLAFLGLSIITDLFKSNITGMTNGHLSPDTVKNLPVPLLEEKTIERIDNGIRKAFTLRQQANNALECAKRAVELAIEQDEQTAMDW